MNFDSLKEQLADQARELWGKIEESSAYITLKERYDGLSPRLQQMIVGGAVALLILFVLSFPYSYVSDAQANLGDFENNRQLTENLLEASRSLHETPPLPPGMDTDMLKAQVKRVASQARLLPEQIGEMSPLSGKITSLAPAIIDQNGISVRLKTLNLRQVVDVSHMLQTITSGIKVIGMDVTQSAAKGNYFDVVYKLVSFSVKAAAQPKSAPSRGRFHPPSRGGK